MSAHELYQLHDVPLKCSVGASDAALHRLVRDSLHELGLRHVASTRPQATDETVHLYVTFGTTAPPASARRLAADDEGELYTCEGSLLFIMPASSIRLDESRKAATVTLDPSAAQAQHHLFSGITRAVLALLRYRGRITLHAACVIAPSEVGCVLAGPSGSGKSTSAMALVQAGWRYLSDDLLLLREGPTGIEALRLLQHFRLFPHAAEQFPEIAASAPEKGSAALKWHVDVEALYPGQAASSCRPGLLLLPRLAETATSSLHPASSTEALSVLLDQINLTHEPEVAGYQLQLCQQLVTQCAAHHLVAGRDLRENPGALCTLLASLDEFGVSGS